MPRRTVYYKPTKAAPKVDPRFAEPIKAMIEKEPSFGYRTVAWLLGFNTNTVQRIFRIKGWQVRKRPIGMRPRIEAVPSVATALNESWSTDLCRVWASRDGWTTLALVIDCPSRELRGWHLSRSGKAMTAASALEHALINRFGTLGKVPREFLLRSDNGLVFTSRRYTALVRSYGLKQEFITPHCPQQNGMVVLCRLVFVIIDELGYLIFAQTGGQLLFYLISRLAVAAAFPVQPRPHRGPLSAGPVDKAGPRPHQEPGFGAVAGDW